MTQKKQVSGLKPMGEAAIAPHVSASEVVKDKVVALTVRMSPEYARALKLACIDRGITQNTFMLELIRRELGLV